ncbi:TPA: phosphohistidine phosphatase, partial [Escherichia coli]
MDGLWEKISSYNIFNNLFPGALFIYLLERMTKIVLSGDDLIKNVVLYYFVGLVIGRIGSIVLEPFLKLSRLIKFAPYKDYVSACGVDGKIETLQEIANMYRTIFSMSIILLATLCVVGRFTGETYGLSKITLAVFAILFVVSYIKQIRYI